MRRQSSIESKLGEALAPDFLEVVNESPQHNVPQGSESHFRVTVVAKLFEDMRLVARHQRVYEALAEELQGGLHALALHTFTPEEWRERGGAQPSPPCLGGSAASQDEK